MFDDVFGMATRCAGTFLDGVHDAFGASIAAEVLEPILREINSLRIFNEEFQRQSFNIDRTLEDARIIQCKDYGHQK
jgi:hypothetical protein